jgi:hypothetical protein
MKLVVDIDNLKIRFKIKIYSRQINDLNEEQSATRLSEGRDACCSCRERY